MLHVKERQKLISYRHIYAMPHLSKARWYLLSLSLFVPLGRTHMSIQNTLNIQQLLARLLIETWHSNVLPTPLYKIVDTMALPIILGT